MVARSYRVRTGPLKPAGRSLVEYRVPLRFTRRGLLPHAPILDEPAGRPRPRRRPLWPTPTPRPTSSARRSSLRWSIAAGKPVPLAGPQGREGDVVVFLSFDCPVSNSYTPTLLDLHKDVRRQGRRVRRRLRDRADGRRAEGQGRGVQAAVPGRSPTRSRRPPTPSRRDHARGVRPRPQPRPALPRPDRQHVRRPAEEEARRSPTTT